MTPEELKERTCTFALRVATLLRDLPRGIEGSTVGPQLLRAAAGVASNYRAACRGRSRRDFVSKIGVAIEEADESDFWLRFAVDLDLLKVESAHPLRTEADELLAILTSSRKTAQARLRRHRDQR
jgi:four helix bundle protein